MKKRKKDGPTTELHLIPELKDMILGSQRILGTIAELLGKDGYTLGRQIRANNRIISHGLTEHAIKQTLCIWDEVVIYDTVTVVKQNPQNA